MRTVIIAVLLTLPAAYGASSDGPSDLGAYLALQRARVPQATVTGGFLDWRGISRYRTHPGLHFGYDIAMPAGSPAVAGWTGQVTAVTAWTDSEFGISVMSPDGRLTTYGHLRPRVRVGDVLNAGDVVGLVVIDHVDIKMRGVDGAYIDFGNRTAAMFPRLQEPPLRQALTSFASSAALEHARRAAADADDMYEAGAISRNTRDRARARVEALEALHR